MSTPQEPQQSSGGGNVFTRKVGPLSLWVWMLIALVVAGGYYLFKKNSANAQNSSTANAASGNSPGGVDASLVPQFINQTYNETVPPAAPNVTVNNTVPVPNPGDVETPPPNKNPRPPKPRPPSVSKYAAPTGLGVTKVSSTSLRATWANLTGVNPPPSSYTVAVYDAGRLVDQQTVNAPDTTGGKSTVTLTGLPANAKKLQVHVWANGGQLAPPHASKDVSL